MGPWWFSQFDRLSEVAQAAKRSLQVILQSIVIFCVDIALKMLDFASIEVLKFYLK